MSNRGRLVAGLLLLVTGGIASRAFLAPRSRLEEAPGKTAIAQTAPERILPALGGNRTEVLAQPGEAAPVTEIPSSVVAERSVPQILRSPLALQLEEVTDSFLTERPRVVELLGLVELMATRAVVDPESMSLQRNPDGDLTFARGTLSIADVRGKFLVDQDGYSIVFVVEDGSWSQRHVRITFQEGDSGPRACHTIVQFDPAPHEAPPDALAGNRELLIGWSLGAGPEAIGTWARPITSSAAEGEWIGDPAGVQPQEFPWVSATGGFDVWWRLLKSCTSQD